jgi:hypothetical protein
MKFRVIEFIPDYVKVGDEYRSIEAEKRYEVSTWDDLQTLLMTMIDFSTKTVRFEVQKREEATDEQ